MHFKLRFWRKKKRCKKLGCRVDTGYEKCNIKGAKGNVLSKMDLYCFPAQLCWTTTWNKLRGMRVDFGSLLEDHDPDSLLLIKNEFCLCLMGSFNSTLAIDEASGLSFKAAGKNGPSLAQWQGRIFLKSANSSGSHWCLTNCITYY